MLQNLHVQYGLLYCPQGSKRGKHYGMCMLHQSYSIERDPVGCKSVASALSSIATRNGALPSPGCEGLDCCRLLTTSHKKAGTELKVWPPSVQFCAGTSLLLRSILLQPHCMCTRSAMPLNCQTAVLHSICAWYQKLCNSLTSRYANIYMSRNFFPCACSGRRGR